MDLSGWVWSSATLEAALASPVDVIGQGGLRWRVAYDRLATDQSVTRSPHIAYHEDLLQNSI